MQTPPVNRWLVTTKEGLDFATAPVGNVNANVGRIIEDGKDSGTGASIL